MKVLEGSYGFVQDHPMVALALIILAVFNLTGKVIRGGSGKPGLVHHVVTLHYVGKWCKNDKARNFTVRYGDMKVATTDSATKTHETDKHKDDDDNCGTSAHDLHAEN